MIVRDDLTGQPRLVAPERAKRLGPAPDGCPFCAGNEEATPPELARVGSAAGSWSARAVPNLFPLVERHEVLISSPRHITSLRELNASEWLDVLRLWQVRLDAHRDREQEHGEYRLLFVNDGKAAGASLAHSHAQLVVAPCLALSDDLWQRNVDPQDCAACRSVAANTEGPLVVWHSSNLLLWASPTPRAGGGAVLAPRLHQSRLDDLPVEELAQAMGIAVRSLPDADFNCWLAQHESAGAHWYIEFVPRQSIQAGVEIGLGIGVSIVQPEAAAAAARERLAT